MRPSWILKFYMYFMYLYHSAIGDSIICDHMVIGMQLKNKKYINPKTFEDQEVWNNSKGVLYFKVKVMYNKL